MAAGDIVQNTLRPSMRQPVGVRVARRLRTGQVLAALADRRGHDHAVARDPAIEAPNARVRRSSPAASAIRQRRTISAAGRRCMFTPIATDASPRASRLDATTTSWTHATPSPPCSAGTGAAK